VALLTFAAFLPALQSDFVTWDDDRNFTGNIHYRGLGTRQLTWMWTTFHMGHYVPLSWMTLGLDYDLWGMNAAGYHLTNVLLHTANAVLDPTKQKVLDTKKMLDEARITEQRAALCDAADQAFYNTSKFTLRDLRSRGSQQQLLADFEDYLNGFSPNVQDILENFKFRNQLQTLSKADAIGTLINKFLDPDIDLSPAGIDNHSMGTVFEELVRKFNEENNEEAGEHWTPRDAVRLMANLVFLPIQAEIKSGTYLLYDCACGTGGMLTVAEETLASIGEKRGQQVKCLLYGQEINPETYAVCKADMLLKGEGESADHIVGGAEWSTLSHDAFPAQEFDFMLANPPYGKSWKKDLEVMGGKDGMRDPRFKVMHAGEELSLVTRSSDLRIELVSRLRVDASLHAVNPPRRAKGRHGRKPKHGRRLGKLSALARSRSAYRLERVMIYGRSVHLLLREFEAYWPALKRVIKVVITQDPRRPRRHAFLVTTDLRLSAIEVVESFAQRWTIEQLFTVAKNHMGLDTAEVRKERPVLRHATLCMALITWTEIWAYRTRPLTWARSFGQKLASLRAETVTSTVFASGPRTRRSRRIAGRLGELFMSATSAA
jgi:hypothetical protein